MCSSVHLHTLVSSGYDRLVSNGTFDVELFAKMFCQCSVLVGVRKSANEITSIWLGCKILQMYRDSIAARLPAGLDSGHQNLPSWSDRSTH
jgi:hypothetical protein